MDPTYPLPTMKWTRARSLTFDRPAVTDRIRPVQITLRPTRDALAIAEPIKP
ncbi:unannotated protein [freshwater metagenome]|uniref:Unannotated protein n=1 Tax=freshwater metagenome TaxID=449393 RepID=A0A6J7DS73_9ZZZZ